MTLKCSKCGGKTKVYVTRGTGEIVYRGRYCEDCGRTFYTIEQEVDDPDITSTIYKVMAGMYRRRE